MDTDSCYTSKGGPRAAYHVEWDALPVETEVSGSWYVHTHVSVDIFVSLWRWHSHFMDKLWAIFQDHAFLTPSESIYWDEKGGVMFTFW